jgi:hypothetical protein
MGEVPAFEGQGYGEDFGPPSPVQPAAGDRILRESINALGAAAADARKVIRQAHEVTGDLRRLVSEARALIRTETEGRIKEILDAEVHRAVTELGDATEKAMAASVDKVSGEFTKLERLFLGVRHGAPSLAELGHRALALEHEYDGVPPAFRAPRKNRKLP